MYEIIKFSKISDHRGSLTFLQEMDHIPFKITKVFFNFKTIAADYKKFSSKKNQKELIIALKGSFDVVITDGDDMAKKINLKDKNHGIYLYQNTGRHIKGFSKDCISLHIFS